MRFQLVGLVLSLTAYACSAQQARLSDWPKLVDAGKRDAAKSLCTSFVDSKNVADQVEAQKCLANVALCGNDVVQLERDDAGGGTIRQGYEPEAVDEALAHLNAALKLAPQDITIHEGRLKVLEMAGRYQDMVKALDESCSIYKGNDARDAWLNYASEFVDLRQYQTGLEFMQVLDKHYPNDPDILGNIGAFLSYLKRDSDAVPYLQRATELAPNDPINAWDLGREYDYTDQVALADEWYKKGLALMRDPDELKESNCLYAEFVQTKLHDRERACKMERQSCPKDKLTACGSPARSPSDPN